MKSLKKYSYKSLESGNKKTYFHNFKQMSRFCPLWGADSVGLLSGAGKNGGSYKPSQLPCTFLSFYSKPHNRFCNFQKIFTEECMFFSQSYSLTLLAIKYLEAQNCVKGHCWAIVLNTIFIGSPFGSQLHSATQKSHINIAFVKHGCPAFDLKWIAIVRVHSVCCQQK